VKLLLGGPHWEPQQCIHLLRPLLVASIAVSTHLLLLLLLLVRLLQKEQLVHLLLLLSIRILNANTGGGCMHLGC
jgi:hypothetical protein